MWNTQPTAPLLSMLLFVGTLQAAPPPDGRQIPRQASRLAQLVDTLDAGQANARWDLAGIALDSMLEVYRDELGAAARERPSSEAKRKKLARWRQATGQLIARIETARNRLLELSDYQLFTDARKQVLIVAGEQTLAVSGFNPVTDKRIEQLTIAQYCSIYDCSDLTSPHPDGGAIDDEPQGTWRMSQYGRPGYVIDQTLVCSFDDIRDRKRKAKRCEQLAGEIAESSFLIAKTGIGERHPDVSGFELRASADTGEALLIWDTSGDSLRLSAPLIARLSSSDRQHLVTYLMAGGPARMAQVEHADRLLGRYSSTARW